MRPIFVPACARLNLPESPRCPAFIVPPASIPVLTNRSASTRRAPSPPTSRRERHKFGAVPASSIRDQARSTLRRHPRLPIRVPARSSEPPARVPAFRGPAPAPQFHGDRIRHWLRENARRYHHSIKFRIFPCQSRFDREARPPHLSPNPQ